MRRRRWLKLSLVGGLGMACGRPFTSFAAPAPREFDALGYELQLDVDAKLFDGRRCWCHPRAGIVPGAGKNGLPRVVMTMNTLDLSGSDVFKATYGLRTDDLGETWVTVAEWMQPRGVQKHGSDGSVFVARIHWSVSNKKV